MTKLLLYIGEGKMFDRPLAERAIESVEGILECRRGDFIGSVFECAYRQPNGAEAIVRISKGEETVTIDGRESDGLKFVFAMQQNYPESIRVTDMDYRFDVDVSLHTTEAGLLKAVQGSEIG